MNEAIDIFVRTKSEGIRHSGRSFYRHLRGTYELLAGAPEYVRLAGFCHSIYGTNVFKTAAVPIAMRNEVAKLIGDRAEFLAYVFCACNRPAALVKAARGGPPYVVENRASGEPIELSTQELCDLLAIEMANLREQDSSRALPGVERAYRAVRRMLTDAA